MATVTGKTRCITCGKDKATSKCSGCLQDYCLNHLIEHRKQLSKQLDEIEVTRDSFQQTIIEQKTGSQKHPLIQQINQWEQDSVEKIRQTAEEARKTILSGINMNSAEIEEKLNVLTDQLKSSRIEDDITENDLQIWKEELQQLTEQLTKPSNIVLQDSETPLITGLIAETISKIHQNSYLKITGMIMRNRLWSVIVSILRLSY